MIKQICLAIILLIFSISCSKKNNDWYLIEKLDNRTYIISEPNSSQANSSFLIIGDKEAILFDSGTGENKEKNITQITDSLTNLPVTLLLSHFHFDHIGFVNDFNRIGIPEIQLLKNRLTVDSLLSLTKNEVLLKDTLILKISRLFPIEKEIDLGNRKIKILYSPGHSEESISIIDSESKYIFSGDLIYNGLLLLNDSKAYIKSINNILENSNPDYRVFGSHAMPEVKYERLMHIKKAIEYYHADSCSIQQVRQINFFGSTKDMYKIGDVSFIDGYTDVFINN